MNVIHKPTCTKSEQNAQQVASEMKAAALKEAIALAWDSQPNAWKLQTIHSTNLAFSDDDAFKLALTKWADYPEHTRNIISQAIIRGIQLGRTWSAVLLAANEQLVVRNHERRVKEMNGA